MTDQEEKPPKKAKMSKIFEEGSYKPVVGTYEKKIVKQCLNKYSVIRYRKIDEEMHKLYFYERLILKLRPTFPEEELASRFQGCIILYLAQEELNILKRDWDDNVMKFCRTQGSDFIKKYFKKEVDDYYECKKNCKDYKRKFKDDTIKLIRERRCIKYCQVDFDQASGIIVRENNMFKQ